MQKTHFCGNVNILETIFLLFYILRKQLCWGNPNLCKTILLINFLSHAKYFLRKKEKTIKQSTQPKL